MSKIYWPRVLGCGLLAGIVWIILGSAVTALLGRDFAALPNNHLAAPTPGFILFNAVLDLIEGVSILWLYAAIRPRSSSRRSPAPGFTRINSSHWPGTGAGNFGPCVQKPATNLPARDHGCLIL
jgi:hypothetical protein